MFMNKNINKIKWEKKKKVNLTREQKVGMKKTKWITINKVEEAKLRKSWNKSINIKRYKKHVWRKKWKKVKEYREQIM